MRVTLFSLWLVLWTAALPGQLIAQDEPDADVQEEKDQHRLASEVGKLKAEYEAMVALMSEKLAASEAQRAELQAQLQLAQAQIEEKAHVDRVRQRVDELQIEDVSSIAGQEALTLRIADIEAELDALRAHQAAVLEQKGIQSWQLEASRTLVTRLAEAQIEHRLAMLVAQARMAAIEEMMKTSSDRTAELRVRQAAQLLDNRQRALQLSQEKAERIVMLQRDGIASQLEFLDAQDAVESAKADLAIAEASLELEKENMNRGDPELHKQFAAASLDLAVSQRLLELFAVEEAEISTVLETADELESWVRKRTALEQELAALRRRRGEDEMVRRIDEERRAAEIQSALSALRAEEQKMLQMLGAEHPSVKAIRKQLEEIEQYIIEQAGH